MTRIRGAGNSFPAVDALKALAADVRGILGGDTKIGYAADWSEYFGYHPQDGSGDVYFHLDPLWADPNIDFIGIDNYMPLSDWRDGTDHEDAYWGSIYNPDYLAANIEGGEGFDWYYHSNEAREAQIRTPIEDLAHGENWIWRYKDIRGWWASMHHNRVGGVKTERATEWVPCSKPIRFTEFGCAAIEKGSNQPNKFVDPKSSESGLPYFSSGMPDAFIQRQYFKAMLSYWKDPFNNPVSEVYGGSMIDMDHAYAWAWDARPWPVFPNNRELWADASNYTAGHWLNGRTSARAMGDVLREICENAGVTDVDTTEVFGMVRGYLADAGDTGRAEIQPLLLSHGVQVTERYGKLVFRTKDAQADIVLNLSEFVENLRDGSLRKMRGSEAEEIGRVRLGFVEADGRFEAVWEEASASDLPSDVVSGSELPIALTRSEARLTAERWLAETRIARDRVAFGLPHSAADIDAGDVVALADQGLYRIESVEIAEHRAIEAVRVDPEAYRLARYEDTPAAVEPFLPPLPVFPLLMDLPLMKGNEHPSAPHIAVTAEPWPGPVGVYRESVNGGYELNAQISQRAVIGVTETDLKRAALGLPDRGGDLQIRLASGELHARDWKSVLNGANCLAIGEESGGFWEIIQFSDAELIGTDIYLVRNRLRGQFGTDAVMPDVWPVGSKVVLLDQAVAQIELPPSLRNISQKYRIGPASRALDGASYLDIDLAFKGNGLRPYAPCHLRMNNDGADHVFSWVRRSRIEGDRWEGEVPLGEESETYLVRVTQTGAVLREVTVTTSVWRYSKEDQASDGVSNGYQLEVAQLSASFGAGGWAWFAVSG